MSLFFPFLKESEMFYALYKLSVSTQDKKMLQPHTSIMCQVLRLLQTPPVSHWTLPFNVEKAVPVRYTTGSQLLEDQSAR
jgi:hypothetical protein